MGLISQFHWSSVLFIGLGADRWEWVNSSIPCAPRLSSSGLSFSLEGEAVCDHSDEFTISNAKSCYFCAKSEFYRCFPRNLLRSYSRSTILIGWYEYYITLCFKRQARPSINVSLDSLCPVSLFLISVLIVLILASQKAIRHLVQI
jgi:hypothetical protein